MKKSLKIIIASTLILIPVLFVSQGSNAESNKCDEPGNYEPEYPAMECSSQGFSGCVNYPCRSIGG